MRPDNRISHLSHRGNGGAEPRGRSRGAQPPVEPQPPAVPSRGRSRGALPPAYTTHSSRELPPLQPHQQGEQAEFDRLSAQFRAQCRKDAEQEMLEKYATAAPPPPVVKPGPACEDSQKCPVCYEVMLPPDASPQMCVPCGHTFCERCLSRLRRHAGAAPGGVRCPVCRAEVRCQVPNRSLRTIVESLAEAPRPGGDGGPELSPELDSAVREHVAPPQRAQAREYVAAFAMADARDRIVAAEEATAAAELGAATQRADVERGVVDYLAKEEEGLRARLAELRRELDANQVQMSERAASLDAAQGEQLRLEDRVAKLRLHRESISRDALKARTILSHIAPGVDLALV